MKKISIIFYLIISLLLCKNSTSQDLNKENQIKIFVENIGNNISSIAKNKDLSELKKREKIIALVDEAVDPDWISRFVLGSSYKNLSDDQKNLFAKLYREFMVNTYAPKFKNYNYSNFEVKSVTKQQMFYLVKSQFTPKDSNVNVLVDFRIKEKDGKMFIIDFIAEGISLIETQRSEFNSVISQKGIEKFLEELTKRVAKLKSTNNS